MTLNPSNSAIAHQRRAIGIFPNRSAAERALYELRDSGFPMEQVSIIAQDTDRSSTIASTNVNERPEDNKADDGAKVGALSGGALGGLTGLLVGIGALAIPGIGPIMLAGAAATALATTAAGSAIGAAAGGILGGLVGLGIPEERARFYNERVSTGEYLVMVDGTDTEIARAEAILKHRGIQEWEIYDLPKAGVASVTQTVKPVQTPNRPIPPAIPTTATDEEAVKLHEERLIVDKDRKKTGEVAIGKHIEVETVQVPVLLEKESVVIERIPGDASAVVSGSDAFRNDEVIRMDVYEETPDIRKEAFVREEVNIRKEVTQEIVKAEETLRREELEINTQDHPVVENRSDLHGDSLR